MTWPLPLLALEFGNPGLLWGLLLMGVPLLLHLLFRRTQHIEPWAAMRFLQAAIRRRRQRLRLESLLQLMIRSALLGAIVLAAADPQWTTASGAGEAGRQVHRLLLLDTSLSMQATDGRESSFDRAIKAAEVILNEARPGDSFQVLQNHSQDDRAVISRPSFDREGVLKELKLLTPGSHRGELVQTLREAELLLQQAPADSDRELVLITDFQTREWFQASDRPRAGLRDLLVSLNRDAELRLVDTSVDALPNSGILRFQPLRPWVFTNQPVPFELEVSSDGAASSVTAELQVDGAPHSRIPVPLIQGRGTVSTPISFLTPGDHTVTMTLPEDGLSPDNLYQTSVRVRRSLNILVTAEPGAQPQTNSPDYLVTALSLTTDSGNTLPVSESTGRFNVELVFENDLRTRNLTEVDCLVLRNPGTLQPDEVRRLADFVMQGGGLILAPSASSNVGSINSLFSKETNLAPLAFSEQDDRIVELNVPLFFQTDFPEHPVLRPFEGYPDGGFNTTRVYRYYQAQPVSAESRVIVRLENGHPVLAERSVGRGRVLMLTVPFHDDWTSWVLWPSFIPMLHEAVQYASAGRVAVPHLAVGDPFTWIMPESSTVIPAVMIRPGGETVKLSTDPANGGSLTYTQTDQPGVFRLVTSASGESYPVIVQIPEEETDLTHTPPGQLTETLLNGIPVRMGQEATGGSVLRGTKSPGRRDSRGELTELLLLLAALLLLADILSGWSMILAALCLLLGLLAGASSLLLHVPLLYAAGMAATLLALCLTFTWNWTPGSRLTRVS